ncbi:hypothetical protein V8G54_028320 [Vigna mungo]|uniref:Uncharacterized protein n=1 Tax=Vigna mungo TaxID=3915 RepID=A0AAQ3MSS2_VIGMU
MLRFGAYEHDKGAKTSLQVIRIMQVWNRIVLHNLYRNHMILTTMYKTYTFIYYSQIWRNIILLYCINYEVIRPHKYTTLQVIKEIWNTSSKETNPFDYGLFLST